MNKVAGKALNHKSFGSSALSLQELSRLRPFMLFFEFFLTLEDLERNSLSERVTIQAYSAVQMAAASLFSVLLKALPPRVAREAQSAIQNALFSLDLEDPKKGGA